MLFIIAGDSTQTTQQQRAKKKEKEDEREDLKAEGISFTCGPKENTEVDHSISMKVEASHSKNKDKPKNKSKSKSKSKEDPKKTNTHHKPGKPKNFLKIVLP